MLWLIWIALILLTPIGAGVRVWWQLHHTPHEATMSSPAAQLASQVNVSSADGTSTH